jgi:hypothetical protein
MLQIEKFLTYAEPKKQLGYFTDAELEALAGKFPEEIIEFLKQEGKCTYRNDFLSTVLPDDYYPYFKDWDFRELGIDPVNCHVFMKTSFGALFYYHLDNIYYFVPEQGLNSIASPILDFALNILLAGSTMMELWLYLHEFAIEELPLLNTDQMYSLDPPIVLGGTTGKSTIKIADMKERFKYLSELYKRKIETDYM